ncbi:MAG: hypothetical protein V1914_01770 [archaeon]
MATEILTLLNALGFTKESTVPVMFSTFLIVVVLICAYYQIGKRFYKIDKIFMKALNPIKNAIVEIQTLITSKGVTLNHLLTEKSGTPLELNDYGEELVTESGLDKIIKEHKKKLFEELKKKLEELGSKTPYDVQECSRIVLMDNRNSKFMEPVKKYAFENAINVDIILRTGGLILRDLYLGKK